jgi:hypothetical protein
MKFESFLVTSLIFNENVVRSTESGDENELVYCPCTFQTVCTDSFGDVNPCAIEQHNGECPVTHDLYGNSSHIFDEGNCLSIILGSVFAGCKSGIFFS